MCMAIAVLAHLLFAASQVNQHADLGAVQVSGHFASGFVTHETTHDMFSPSLAISALRASSTVGSAVATAPRASTSAGLPVTTA